MSLADDDRFAAMFDTSSWLPTVTRDAVASALDGFTLSLAHGKDMDWLTMATRRSLAGAHRYPAESSGRTSNAELRANLKRLADLAVSIWQKLFQLDHATKYRLIDYATQHWDGEGGTEIGDGVYIGDPSDYRRFKAAVVELDWLAGFLRQAAKATKSQRGPWRQSDERRLRIERGQFLAPIFEAAFGQPISANNWPGDALHKSPTAFMDFYQRMVSLAFGENATPDLSGVLKAARQLHEKHPVQFVEGFIPGL